MGVNVGKKPISGKYRNINVKDNKYEIWEQFLKEKNTCNTMSIINTLGYLGGSILNIKLIKLCKIRPFFLGLVFYFLLCTSISANTKYITKRNKEKQYLV